MPRPPARSELGERLRALREGRRLTQQSAGEHLGVDRVTVSNWERGATIPEPVVLERIAAFYGVPAADLARRVSAGPGVTHGHISLAAGSPNGTGSGPAEPAEAPGAKVLRNYEVRVWLSDFRGDLVKAGLSDEEVEAAVRLATSPDAFVYAFGGRVREMTEAEALEELEAIGQYIRHRARERVQRRREAGDGP